MPIEHVIRSGGMGGKSQLRTRISHCKGVGFSVVISVIRPVWLGYHTPV